MSLGRWLPLFGLVALGLAGCAPKPTATEQPAAKSADPGRALTVLQQNQEAMAALKSYQAQCVTKVEKEGEPTSYLYSLLAAEKPNKMRYDAWPMKSPPTGSRPTEVAYVTIATDGKDQYNQFGKEYMKTSNAGAESLSTFEEPWVGFFTKSQSILGRMDQIREGGGSSEATIGADETVDGTPCDVVTVTDKATNGEVTQEVTKTYWIGKNDHLVRKQAVNVKSTGPGDKAPKSLQAMATISQIVADKELQGQAFSYAPPTGVTLRKPDAGRPPVLANGSSAPDFTVQDAQGKPVRLSGFRGKVVVIDFWASWCGPCKESMPHTQSVAKKLAAEGLPVVVLAVDDGEDRGGFDAWLKDNSALYPNLVFLHSTEEISHRLYRVTGIPTQFILDKAGIVRKSFVGFGGPTDDLEKAVRSALAG
ncbi:MAG: TlpA family protein disulfide reductase [Armatimonadetes bacterium]|nr:TlpA family protein disulfide reductase [Armatimonadota bacterium]